jgi:two-component system nitrogen regulation response regulator GlnG
MKHFLGKSAQTLGGDMKSLTPAAMQIVQGFAFPGNVRQLENICHWITVMAPGNTVDVADLPPEVRPLPGGESVAAASESALGHVPPQVLAPAREVAPPFVASQPNFAATSAAPAASGAAVAASFATANGDWQHALAGALASAIQQGERAPGERLTREFEATMIRSALTQTKGRRIEASEWLGWGRNTLTRKIHELGMDGEV